MQVTTSRASSMLTTIDDKTGPQHEVFEGNRLNWSKLKSQISALKKRVRKTRKANKEARAARRLHRQGK